MKKFSIFFTVLVIVISCSKDLENKITYENDDLMETKDKTGLPSIVSLDTTDLCKYLIKKPLTNYEKDSIAKVALLSITYAKGPIYGTVKGESPEYSDYSGYIHLKVFYETTGSKIQHPILFKSVPSDYAMVGGGALAWGYTGNGAFLTESRPINGTTWQGQSKDHIIQDPHYLTVYAIGMRIDSVDPTFLRSKIHIVSTTSSYSDFPWTSISVPNNCLLIGGGAFDNYNGYGNMLVSSNPYGNEWAVSGKAYRRSDPSQITAYAIGIEDISYPTVGYLQVTVRQTTEGVSSGVGSCYAPVWEGYALTCPGGVATYHNIGRMLVGIYPQDLIPGAQVISKDTPGYADYGTTSAYAVGIQKRPY